MKLKTENASDKVGKSRDATIIGIILLLIYVTVYFDPGINMLQFMIYSKLVLSPISSFVVFEVAKKQGREPWPNAIAASIFPVLMLLVIGQLGNKQKVNG